jgi:GntR family transcriptional regulator, transcriptional repressor for pyruvate dehydrogenase complex
MVQSGNMSSQSPQASSRPNAAEVIAQTLRREIVDQMRDGDPLGSAQELMERFDVSGPTIRQAMRVLEAEGLVRARRGNSGGFFASTPSVEVVTRAASALLRRQGADLADMFLLSGRLGSEYVRLAADNPDADARRRVKRRVEEILPKRGAVDLATVLKAGIAVPRLLGELSGSPTLALFAAVTGDLIVGLTEYGGPASTTNKPQSYARRARDAYVRLLTAVADGDATRAQAEWRQIHLIGTELIQDDDEKLVKKPSNRRTQPHSSSDPTPRQSRGGRAPTKRAKLQVR